MSASTRANPIREALDRVDVSPSAEFIATLRSEVLSDFAAPHDVAVLIEPEAGAEHVVVDVKRPAAPRRPRQLRKALLAAAALVIVFTAAAVVTLRQRDPVEKPNELHQIDPDKAMPLAFRAVMSPKDLGALWSEGPQWPDATTYRSLVADTEQALPECAQLARFGLMPPTDRSVTAQQNFFAADKWMFRQVTVFATAEDASKAMDVIAGQTYPRCLFDLIDRIIPLGSRMNATTKSEPWQAPPVAPHGDRQVSFGQLVRYTTTGGPVDIYLINVFVQIGPAIAWVDPQYFPDSTTPLYRVDRAVDASTSHLAWVFGN